jgi:hypothetical protein
LSRGVVKSRNAGDRLREESLKYAMGTAVIAKNHPRTKDNHKPKKKSKRQRKEERKLVQRDRREVLPPSMYEEYIHSPRWYAFKRRLIKIRGNKCEACPTVGDKLDLHHLTYVRLGCERPEDVKLLCRACHQATSQEVRTGAVKI